MAKAKKRATKKKSPTSKSKAKAKPRTKPRAKAKRATPPRRKTSDVERRWKDYSECRAALENAVSAVRDAEQLLTAARQLESKRRAVFDSTKAALQDLLEVEPASNSGDAEARAKPHRPVRTLALDSGSGGPSYQGPSS